MILANGAEGCEGALAFCGLESLQMESGSGPALLEQECKLCGVLQPGPGEGS